MADYSAQQRRDMARQGKAMRDPGGGPPKFPLATVDDVKSAVRLHGRVASSQQPAVRRHIIRNAKRLGAAAMAAVPDHWNTDGSLATSSSSS